MNRYVAQRIYAGADVPLPRSLASFQAQGYPGTAWIDKLVTRGPDYHMSRMGVHETPRVAVPVGFLWANPRDHCGPS
jgi:hypothetical protein